MALYKGLCLSVFHSLPTLFPCLPLIFFSFYVTETLTRRQSAGRKVTFNRFKRRLSVLRNHSFYHHLSIDAVQHKNFCLRVSSLTYFQSLVFHFHDELLLLLLARAGFLQLGLDAVDLHLVFHDCGKHCSFRSYHWFTPQKKKENKKKNLLHSRGRGFISLRTTERLASTAVEANSDLN